MPADSRRHGVLFRMAAVLLATALVGCGAPPAPPADPLDTAALEPIEATSLLRKPLRRPALPDEVRRRLEENLSRARARHDEAPGEEETVIWLGRRLAYLGRHGEAVEVFSGGIAAHPESYKLLRHRGHRHVTLRRLDDAIADLSRAAELAADRPESPRTLRAGA